MESMHLNVEEKIKKDLTKEYDEALKDPNFLKLVKKINVKDSVGEKYTSRLKDTVGELENCQKCQGLFMCQNKVNGYVNYPVKEDNKLNFVCAPCKYQKEFLKKQEAKNDSLNELKKARIKDIDATDGNRVKVIKWIMEFYKNYEPFKNLKGLYLHGNFGSGKTFLLATLLNELSIKKKARIEIVYFPELLRNLKEDFSLIEDRLNYLMNVDILLLDDIGAENVTAWGRDEILGPILQMRMNHQLPTFFTSNLTIEELESNLSMTKASVDQVKARRIVERIKQLSTDMELVSVNRRK